MPLSGTQNFTFKPTGLTDSIDGSNAPRGSLSACTNLIWNPGTLQCLVPRPAATQVADMATKFSAPTGITALVIFGTVVYGFVSSNDYPGKDVPFAYDLSASAFLNITGLSSALLPNTQVTAGDWVPPVIQIFSNACMVFAHPGFTDGVHMFGWLDMSRFVSSGITGDITVSSRLIQNLSADPYLAGIEPGQLVTNANYPAGTYVVSTTTAPNTVLVSQVATGSAVGSGVVFSGGTPSAPLWGAGNTNRNALSAPPMAVAQFGNRAYFGVGNALVWSDVLRPRQISSSAQAAILGDNQPITALSATPFKAPLTGGMVTALLAFKGVASVWQVVGDQALSNLSINLVNGAVGTLAPNTIAPTPDGTTYVAPDGVRAINLEGQCIEPLGVAGDGIRTPFWQSPYASRMSAAFAHNVLRISLQDGSKANQPWDEYWYDYGRKGWTGPHTFAALLMAGYPNAPAIDWIAVPQSAPTKLFASSAIPLPNSVFTENGTPLGFTYQTSLLPDNQEGSMNSVIQAAQAMILSAGQQATVIAMNESGTTIDQVVLNGTNVAAGVWGAFVWGGASWGIIGGLKQYSLSWPKPLEFKQMSLQITGQSVPNLALGNTYVRYKPLGYLLDPGYQL